MVWEMESIRQGVCVAGVVLVTILAVYTDSRLWKIPNKLTVPAFALGLVYQLVFNGLPGLSEAALAFAVGFGTFFLLWMVGGGGAGDVKLVGALSVWIGFRNTLAMMILSTVFVLLGAMLVVVWNALRHGARKTKERYLATGKKPGTAAETYEQKRRRSILAFAAPVALATWMTLALDMAGILGGQLVPRKANRVATSSAAHSNTAVMSVSTAQTEEAGHAR